MIQRLIQISESSSSLTSVCVVKQPEIEIEVDDNTTDEKKERRRQQLREANHRYYWKDPEESRRKSRVRNQRRYNKNRAVILARNRPRAAKWRLNNAEKLQAQKPLKNAKAREKRKMMTPEQHAKENAQHSQAAIIRRLLETPEQKEKRLANRREYESGRRARMTPEQKVEERRKKTEYQRNYRARKREEKARVIKMNEVREQLKQEAS